MKSTFLFGLIAVSSAITVEPTRATVAGLTRQVEDQERHRELASTLDSLAQAEKEVGMKMEAPKKEKKTAYTGIGADTPLSKQAALDEEEDNDNTMASFNEAQKEANAYQSAEQIKK